MLTLAPIRCHTLRICAGTNSAAAAASLFALLFASVLGSTHAQSPYEDDVFGMRKTTGSGGLLLAYGSSTSSLITGAYGSALVTQYTATNQLSNSKRPGYAVYIDWMCKSKYQLGWNYDNAAAADKACRAEKTCKVSTVTPPHHHLADELRECALCPCHACKCRV